MNCYESAKRASLALLANNQTLSVAESCTGGKISRTATTVVGSSGWFDMGFTTYSNQSKIDILGVQKETIERHSPVSSFVAHEMLQGVLDRTTSDWAIAVTGIAGPGGATEEDPVGTVYVGHQMRGCVPLMKRLNLTLDRHLLQIFVSKFCFDILADQLS